MISIFTRSWAKRHMPFFFSPRHEQVAALCWRDSDKGRQILLITSRDTGRWIVPKGWPIKGLDGPHSALQEAWEEAGVREAEVHDKPVGSYAYAKGLDDGKSIPIETQVYAAKVTTLRDDYPEADQRERAWFDPREAANLVDEPDLKQILQAF